MDPQQLQQAIQALQALIASLKKEQPTGTIIGQNEDYTVYLEDVEASQEKQIENNETLQEQLDEILKTEKTRNQQIAEQEALIEELQKRREGASEMELEQLNQAIKKRKEIIAELKQQKKEENDLAKQIEQNIKKRIDSFKKEHKEIIGISKALVNMGKVAAQQAQRFTGFDAGMLSVEKVRERVFALDDLGQEIRRTTGMSQNFFNVLADSQQNLKQFGLSSAASAKSIASLASGFSDFTRLTDTNQIASIADFTTKMTLLGVSTDNTAGIFEFATKVMGDNVTQAQDMQEELVQSARAIGMQPQIMTQAFARNAPKLALYGDNIIKVFKNLAVQSKATGIGMDSLIGLAEGFTTFEGAARKTAQLNAMFGTQLNSVELMMAAAEGTDVLVSKLQDTFQGMNFEGPGGFFALKSLSDIVGFSPKDLKALIQGKKTIEEIQEAAQGTSKVPLDQLYAQNVKLTEQQAALAESLQNIAGKQLRDTMKETANRFVQIGGLADKMSGQAKITGDLFAGMTKTATDGLMMMDGLMAKGLVFASSMANAFGPLVNAVIANTGMLGINTMALLKGSFGGGGGGMGNLIGRGASRAFMRGGALSMGRVALGGAAGGVLAGGLDAYSRYQRGESTERVVGGGLTSGLGAMGGMMLGAKLGLIGGPLGVAIGAAAGAALGGLAGTTAFDAVMGPASSPSSQESEIRNLESQASSLQRQTQPQVADILSRNKDLQSTNKALMETIKGLTAAINGNTTATEINSNAINMKTRGVNLASP